MSCAVIWKARSLNCIPGQASTFHDFLKYVYPQ